METTTAKRKKLIIIAAVAAAAAVALMLVLMFSSGGKARELSKQLDLGKRYLDELDYDNALIAYNKAIDIDPKCEDAYIGAADAYIGKGDYETAREMLSEGLAQIPNDAKIMEKMNELAAIAASDVTKKSGNSFSQSAEISGKSSMQDTATPPDFRENTSDFKKSSVTEGNQSVIQYEENLKLSNANSYYTEDTELLQYNEGAVGSMVVSCTVEGPSEVCDVHIGGWYSTALPSNDSIYEMIATTSAMWKQEITSVSENAPPFFRVEQSHPVYAEQRNQTAYVVMVGLDKNMDVVGYGIIEEQIP